MRIVYCISEIIIKKNKIMVKTFVVGITKSINHLKILHENNN